jgi:large subunit ribosomal protein L31
VDTEGQVDRFYRKLQARQDYIDEIEAREAERVSPDRPITDLELGKRATDSLANAGVIKVGQALDKLALGEDQLLSIAGFGRKSLADLKKRLRSFGYTLPEDSEEIKV